MEDNNIDTNELPYWEKSLESSLETIDAALFEYYRDHLNINVSTNRGNKKVPVLFSTFERAYVAEKYKDIRDGDGSLIYPIISVTREGFSKDISKKSTFWANMPSLSGAQRGHIAVSRRLSGPTTQKFTKSYRDSYPNSGVRFQVKREKSPRLIYDVKYIPQVYYVEVSYTVSIRTDYRQQMNTIVQTIMGELGNQNYFVVEKNGHRFEAFIDPDFNHNDDLDDFTAKDKFYQTDISVRVLGYSYGKSQNQESPFRSVRQTKGQVVFDVELLTGLEECTS